MPAAEHLYDGRLFGERLKLEAELAIEGVSFVIDNETRRDMVPPVEIVDVKPSPYVSYAGNISTAARFQSHAEEPSSVRISWTIQSERSKPGDRPRDKSATRRDGNIEHRCAHCAAAEPGRSRVQASRSPLTNRFRKNRLQKETFRWFMLMRWLSADGKLVICRVTTRHLERALAALGVDAKKLTVDEIAKSDLSPFHTIIIDNRGYEAHQDLIPINNRLLKYAEDGGTLLVFYHRHQ